MLLKLQVTNEVSTASGDFRVSTAGGTSQVPSTSCAHDVAYSFFAQPTTSPQLENEHFQQINGDDLEELDLRWQVAMLTVRVKKSERNQGRRSYEPVNYALMAISSSISSSSSDNEVQKCLAVLVFTQGDDPIACLNKAMTFLTVVASLRRQGQSYAATGYKGNATSFGGNNTCGQEKVVKCYNCQGKGHMASQCTQPKRPRNAAWFKEKAMLAEAQEFDQILYEEQLTCLTEDLDAYDYDCDDVSNAKAVLMANISNYGSDVILEVPHPESYHNDMDNQSVHAMLDFEQTPVLDFLDNEITSDSNIHFVLSYLQEHNWQLYQDTNFVISSQHAAIPVIDDEETLILEELNKLSKDFGKHFVPQQELMEAPSELPKVSLVNTSLKKLKIHLSKFDTVVKKRITPDAITEGEWDLLNEETEVQTVFNQMEAAVQQCSDVLLSVMNSTTLNGKSVNLEIQRSESCDKCFAI
ncbi:retrovirus-related pol polyprotein from transposon TNT 1-94 [Tanacetum coccineum]